MDGKEPSGSTQKLVNVLNKYFSSTREELLAAILDAEVPSGTTRHPRYYWRLEREAFLKLGHQLANDDSGEILEHILRAGNSLLITVPILEFLRFEDVASTGENAVEIACSTCFTSLFGRSQIENDILHDEQVVGERTEEHLSTCAKFMEAIDGTKAVQMIDWDFLLRELTHLVDTGDSMRDGVYHHRTDYICGDVNICRYLFQWRPMIVSDLLQAILSNKRAILEYTALCFTQNIAEFLENDYAEVQAGFATTFETTLEGVPSYQQYLSLKRILKCLDSTRTDYDIEKLKSTKKLFYGAKLNHEALLANRVLFAAYIYEEKEWWLPTILDIVDPAWLNIKALGGLLLSSSNADTEEIREQRMRLVYSLLNCSKSRRGVTGENTGKIEWIMAALNEEVDSRLGNRRDLNLFYLPTPLTGKKNLLCRESAKPSILANIFDTLGKTLGAVREEERESLVCVDKSVVNLEPRAQAATEPKVIAKLVSPHKLREEVEKTERVNKMVIPRTRCFHCEDGFVDAAKSSDHTKLLGESTVIWSYSRTYLELEYAPTKAGVELVAVHSDWKSASLSPAKGSDSIDFDDEMCRVLELAHLSGDHTVMCKIDNDTIAPGVPDPRRNASQAKGRKTKKVEIEVSLKFMKVIDRVNKTERSLYRHTQPATPARGRGPTGRLSLNQPATPQMRKEGSGELVKCWVCFGSGYISRWFNEEVAKLSGSPTLSMKRRISADGVTEGSMLDEHMAMCPICYCDPGIYGMSVECDHLFCKDCANSSLEAMLESGQFPASCPMCRAEGKIPDPDGNDAEPVGLISRPALTFLAERDVISKKFQFRFVNAMRRYNNSYLKKENKDQFMECPRKGCDTYLYVPVLKTGEDEDQVLEGQCPCGQIVCLLCNEPVVDLKRPMRIDGEVRMRFHECPKLEQKKKERKEKIRKANLAPDMALLAQLGKKCPACTMFIEKNEGCDVMMCGDSAHGSLRKALTNGGCGLAFHWDTLKAQGDGYTDVNGNRLNGYVMTARMKKDHPKCAREGCRYYMSTDNLTTDLVKNPNNAKNNGGAFCCENCKNGIKNHHNCCHKIVHPDCIDKVEAKLATEMFIKAGDVSVKWFVPFSARLVQVEFDLRNQPKKKYAEGKFEAMIKAMAPTHFKDKGGDGLQFGMEVIGDNGKPLLCRAVYTENVCVSRHHSSLMPKTAPYRIDVDEDPVYPGGVQMNSSFYMPNGVSTMPHILMKSMRSAGDTAGGDDTFRILFDLGESCRIVGLRSILLSHYAFNVSYAMLSAEEAATAKHFFRAYKQNNQTVIFDKDSLKVDSDGPKAKAKAKAKKKEQPPPPLPNARPPAAAAAAAAAVDAQVVYDPQTVQERRDAYQMIAQEREGILAALGDQGCECPACGMIIVKNGGDDNLMCGCEAEAAGGTMAKALAGGGCGLKFNFRSKQPIGNGAPGKPANNRQWRFSK